MVEGEEGEWADDPIKVNRMLFGYTSQEWMTLPPSLGHSAKLREVQIGAGQWVAGATRLAVPIRAILTDGRIVYQPFYRSSGVATPDKSPRGTWWPTGGLYALETCSIMGHRPGYISKYQRIQGGAWASHNKHLSRVGRPWQDISKWLADLIPQA